MQLARKVLLHRLGLLHVRWDECLVDRVLDVPLDKRRHRSRERPRNVVRHIRTQQQPLDFRRERLANTASAWDPRVGTATLAHLVYRLANSLRNLPVERCLDLRLGNQLE